MAKQSHTDAENRYCLHCGVWVVPIIDDGWSGPECPQCHSIDILYEHEAASMGLDV